MNEILHKFEAEVLLLDPANVPRLVHELTAVGCEFTIDHDAVDPCGPTVFGLVTGTTELGEDEVGDMLSDIVGPLGGDVIEWGYVRKTQ